jgi:hypothetical protein
MQWIFFASITEELWSFIIIFLFWVFLVHHWILIARKNKGRKQFLIAFLFFFFATDGVAIDKAAVPPALLSATAGHPSKPQAQRSFDSM